MTNDIGLRERANLLLHRLHTGNKYAHQWYKARRVFHKQWQHEKKRVDPAREIDSSLCKESQALALAFA